MKQFIVIFTFFNLLFASNALFAQSDSISAWQEQIISRLDADEFSEVAYIRLMEMLSDLELSRRDTIFPQRIKQIVILRADRCLNLREGFRNQSPERISNGKAYRGDAWAGTLRYKISVGRNWCAGFVLNKDAGEAWQRKPPFADSFSGYVSFRNTIIGHYRLRLGSGLILNQQFSLGKNMMSETFMDSGTRLSPHSSTDEYSYMQGIASDLRLRRLRLLPFVSFKQIDATVKDGIITSIPTDGYHRTALEASKRYAASVFNAGLHASMRWEYLELGANILATSFSLPYMRPLRTYNINYFRGEELLQASLDFHARIRGFEIRGETAFDKNLNFATISQITHRLGEDWRIALLLRHFGKRYQQLFASVPAEGSAVQGESGATISLKGEPFPHWKLNMMLDYFSFSTVPYGFNEPPKGFDFRSSVGYNRRLVSASLSYRMKLKRDILHSIDGIFSFGFNNGLKFKTQMRGKIFSPKSTGGYSLGYTVAQSIIFSQTQNESAPINHYPLPVIELQAAYFDAQDYNTRLYLSERNILYGFNIPMLYGRGLRAAATSTASFSKKISCDVKYSIFRYSDGRESIGSGLQKIKGATKQDLVFQLRLKL